MLHPPREPEENEKQQIASFIEDFRIMSEKYTGDIVGNGLINVLSQIIIMSDQPSSMCQSVCYVLKSTIHSYKKGC